MDLLKTLVWDNLVKAAIGRLFAAIPFLGWGPIGYLIGFIVTKITDYLYEVMKEWYNVESILLSNMEFKKQWDKASVHLAIVSIDHGENSPEYKEAIIENDNAFNNVIKFRRAR